MFEKEEDYYEMDCELSLVKISKREVLKALETMHSYFEMTLIDDQRSLTKLIASKNI